MGIPISRVPQVRAGDGGTEAWQAILPTFRETDSPAAAEVGSDKLPVGSSPFSENLLRDILDLTPDQQLSLCTELAKGSDTFTKQRLKEVKQILLYL